MEIPSIKSLVYVFGLILTAQLLVQASCRRGFFKLRYRDRALKKLTELPRLCRHYHSTCVPWSRNPRNGCCKSDNLTCKCNLWMQNCRCTSKMWGR